MELCVASRPTVSLEGPGGGSWDPGVVGSPRDPVGSPDLDLLTPGCSHRSREDPAKTLHKEAILIGKPGRADVQSLRSPLPPEPTHPHSPHHTHVHKCALIFAKEHVKILEHLHKRALLLRLNDD